MKQLKNPKLDWPLIWGKFDQWALFSPSGRKHDEVDQEIRQKVQQIVEMMLKARSHFDSDSRPLVVITAHDLVTLTLVPAKPTSAMLKAGSDTGCFTCSDEDANDHLREAGTVYKAMLAAYKPPKSR